MRIAYPKILAATGTDVFDPGYAFEADRSLHKETIKSSGKVIAENYYTAFDAGTEVLSGLAVAVAYTYNGAKLKTRIETFYFTDGTVALTRTTDYKTDSVDINRTVEIRS